MFEKCKQFCQSKIYKILFFSILGLFLLSYVVNSCNPNLMKQFVMFGQMNGFDIFLVIVRCISYISILSVTMAFCYNEKYLNNISVFVVLPASIVSIIFSQSFFELSAIDTIFKVFHYIFYSLDIILCLLLVLKNNFTKDVIKTLWVFVLCLLAFIPLNLLENFEYLMTNPTFAFYTFGIWHFVFLIFAIIVMIIQHFILKHLTKETRFNFMMSLSIIMLFHLLNRFSLVGYEDYHSLSNIFAALPLYVCSFCIILLPFAIASHNKFFQTILFMINVAGAFSVFIYMDPGAGNSIFSYNVTYFTFNHMMLFAVACSLPKLEAQVKYKYFLHLLYIFAIYLVLMSILNNICVINGFNPNYSYVSICPLPIGNIMNIGVLKIGGMSFPLVYLLILYIFYILLFLIGFSIFVLVRIICNAINNKRNKQKVEIANEN